MSSTPGKDKEPDAPGHDPEGTAEDPFLEAVRLEIEALRAMLGLPAPGRHADDPSIRNPACGGHDNDGME